MCEVAAIRRASQSKLVSCAEQRGHAFPVGTPTYSEFKSSPLVQSSVMPAIPLDLKLFPSTFLHYFGVRSSVRVILDV